LWRHLSILDQGCEIGESKKYSPETPMTRDLYDCTLTQLYEAIGRDVAEALAIVQTLVASAPFCDPTLARAEIKLLHAAVAADRAEELLRHSVQVLSGLRLPGEGQDDRA
jgi:hypothetical protein